MKSKKLKAEQLLEEDKIFLMADTDKHSYFVVKGLVGAIYEVIYDKIKETYNCSCKNVKHIDCYHIVAVKKYRDINDND